MRATPILGLLLGMQQALEADHLAAVVLSGEHHAISFVIDWFGQMGI